MTNEEHESRAWKTVSTEVSHDTFVRLKEIAEREHSNMSLVDRVLLLAALEDKDAMNLQKAWKDAFQPEL